MQILPFFSELDLAPAVAACRAVFDRHGVVVIPTETFYGLAVPPNDSVAVAAVCALKGRPAEKALPLVVADLGQAEQLVVLPATWAERLGRVWPAPLTVVAPLRRPLAACGATAALRVPSHPLLRALLQQLGPLTATSANRSGKQPPCSLADVLADLGNRLDLLLDGGPTSGGPASTIVEVCSEPPKLLRPGAFSLPPEWGVKTL